MAHIADGFLGIFLGDGVPGEADHVLGIDGADIPEGEIPFGQKHDGNGFADPWNLGEPVAGLLKGELPSVVTFKWPPMATAFTPEDPLEEAQEGLAAFVSGAASRQGWALENVLWWGASDAAEASAMAQVMALTAGRSRSLSLPVWEAPGLSALMQQAGAKRALWPRLVALGQQWSPHDHSA